MEQASLFSLAVVPLPARPDAAGPFLFTADSSCLIALALLAKHVRGIVYLQSASGCLQGAFLFAVSECGSYTVQVLRLGTKAPQPAWVGDALSYDNSKASPTIGKLCLEGSFQLRSGYTLLPQHGEDGHKHEADKRATKPSLRKWPPNNPVRQTLLPTGC